MKITSEYVAGFFDGEGSISMWRSHNKSNTFASKASITLTNLQLLELLREKYGGTIFKKKVISSNHKKAWSWYVTGENLTVFLKDIYPYLILKKRQTEILLKFRKQLRKNGTRRLRNKKGQFLMNSYNFSLQEIEKRMLLYQELKKLNMRGIYG